jgi:hypothetical protein
MFSLGNTDVSRMLDSAMQSGDYSKIVSASVDPMDYTNAGTFGQDYLFAELMSKYPEWDLGIDRQKVALAKFVEAEALCKDTNRRLLGSYGSSTVGKPSHPILLSAMRKIESLLGSFSWPEVFRESSWGPGATTRLKRAERDVYYKFCGLPHVTHDLFPVAAKMVKSVPGWNPRYLEVVCGNKVTTVPKNAKTDRIIAIEPDLNMVIQKGIGKMIRKRLWRAGLLLDDPRDRVRTLYSEKVKTTAQLRNAELARIGSLTGDFCTIDLSMASDTVSFEIVKSLLPLRWFEALEQSRSPSGILPDGTRVEYQKFSSMGNGYTFELETLIFWALAEAVTELYSRGQHQVLVYGDDIICPTQAAAHVIEALQTFGFVPNLKKTFVAGPFRESCGKHYFRGTDVTPFYIRRPVTDISRRFWLANTIKRYSRCSYGLDPQFKSVYDFVKSKIPKRWWLSIPDGVGDGGLVVDFDEATPILSTSRKGKKKYRRLNNSLEGYQYRFIVDVNSTRDFDDETFLLKALYELDMWDGVAEKESKLSVLHERLTPKWKTANAQVPQWSHFGPWLTD